MTTVPPIDTPPTDSDESPQVTPLDPSAGGTPTSQADTPADDAPEEPEKLSDGDRINLLAKRLGFPDLDYGEPD